MSESASAMHLSHLPGEAEYDESLLCEAVKTLNVLYEARGLEAALRVGEYVLKSFFGGDVEHFRSRGRRHMTFRCLAGREDLSLSYSFIWYAVGVLEQMEQLPREIAEALPLSHHRLLLPVREPRQKLKLAREAFNQNLSKRELEDLIRRSRQKQPRKHTRGGRPPLPDFVKGLRRVTKAVELATRQPVTAETFTTYAPEDAKAMLASLYEDLSRLQDLAEDLRLNLEAYAHVDEAIEDAAQAAK